MVSYEVARCVVCGGADTVEIAGLDEVYARSAGLEHVETESTEKSETEPDHIKPSISLRVIRRIRRIRS